MYKQPLYQIDKVDEVIDLQTHNFPNATRFAYQLLTLPTHEDIDINTLRTICNTLKEI